MNGRTDWLLARPDDWAGGTDEDAWDRLPHTLAAVDRGHGFRTARELCSAQKPAYPLSPPAAGSSRGLTQALLDELGGGALPQARPGSRARTQKKKGPCKRAALLDTIAVDKAEQWIAAHSRGPAIDRLQLRLSVWGGLRAGEIADLPLHNLLDAHHRISSVITVYASKTGTTRRIPMHPLIADAVREVRRCYPQATHAAFSVGADGMLKRRSASCVTNWFTRIYRSAGLVGCSSHSGRRTFATLLSRRLGGGNGSIADLQQVLGHASLSSTQCYLEPSDRFAELVCTLNFTKPARPRDRPQPLGQSPVGHSQFPPREWRPDAR